MSMILALDQSTSATKAVLFDAHGVVVDKASRDHRQLYPQPGWVEHDPEEIWRNTLEVIRELAARHDLRRLAGLSLTNQRETVVVFDRKTGKPLYHAIVWQDRRGDAICAKLRNMGSAPASGASGDASSPEIRRDGAPQRSRGGCAPRTVEELVRVKTGLKIDTYFSASKLNWLIREKPELAAKLRSGQALIGTIDAYLIYRLTGGRVFATDPTNASRTLLFDIRQLRWDDELCALFEVPPAALPEVRECDATFGHTDAAGCLPAPVPICGVMGDSQASLFAQRCFQPGMVKATFGTGTSVLFNLGAQCAAPPEGLVAALAWVVGGRPVYAFEGLINFSAATVSWLKNQLGLIGSAAETEALARSVEDTGGVYLVPAFAGLSAPWWRPDARAALVGMTAHTRREHIVRAALESIAYQLRDVLDLMRSGAGVELRSLHADGGPTANCFLMQFTADVCGVELRVSDVPESSALGAASAGWLGLGLHPSLEALAALPRQWTVYRPQMSPEHTRRLLEGWHAAVKRVL